MSKRTRHDTAIAPHQRTGFVRGSTAVGSVVASSSAVSREAEALNRTMKTINDNYATLTEFLRSNDLMPLIKTAGAYTPPESVAQGFKNYDRWSWFCDYIACKVTGGYGLFGLLDKETLRTQAADICTQIDAQRPLFKEYLALLNEAKETAGTAHSGSLDGAIAAFTALHKSVGALRNIAADISEGRTITTSA